jgi:hypothetical protein
VSRSCVPVESVSVRVNVTVPGIVGFQVMLNGVPMTMLSQLATVKGFDCAAAVRTSATRRKGNPYPCVLMVKALEEEEEEVLWAAILEHSKSWGCSYVVLNSW